MAKKRREEKRPREMTHRQLSHHKRQQRRQRIIFISGIAVIVAVVLIIIGGWFMGEYLPLRNTVIQVGDKSFDAAYFIDSMVIYAKGQTSVNLATLANQLPDQIVQNEMLKQAGAALGISVSTEEATQYLNKIGLPISDAALDFAGGQLLPDKLKKGYFDSQVPVSDNQVDMKAMMVESETVAQTVREKIVSGENFTQLNKEYATNYYSKTNNGDYGWHPASILKDQVGTTIPLDWAFSADVKPGDVSQPISDNVSYKQLGYWLIRVNERVDVETANTSAIFLSSEEEALEIRAKLEAGAELGPIADNFSQYSPSQTAHGEMGALIASDNVTNTFNGYVFSSSPEIGTWSQPIRDSALWTKGGAWLVLVVDKEENRTVSTEDRNTLIDNLYSAWGNELWNMSSGSIINNITTGLQTWLVERASRQL